MSLFINTSDKEKLIKYGFYYTKTSDNKYHKLEYMKRDDSNFDYMLLIAELPNVIYDLINEGLLQKG